MGRVHFTKCDGCGRELAAGAPILSLNAEQTIVESDRDTPRRRFRRKRHRQICDVDIVLCADCRNVPIGEVFDRVAPTCARCEGTGELEDGEDCHDCGGTGEKH